MSFVSFGIPVARSSARRRDRRRSGFTLLEALVALTLVLAFAAVLGPFLFHARRITANADGRVAAQILLRALLEDPSIRLALRACRARAKPPDCDGASRRSRAPSGRHCRADLLPRAQRARLRSRRRNGRVGPRIG